MFLYPIFLPLICDFNVGLGLRRRIHLGTLPEKALPSDWEAVVALSLPGLHERGLSTQKGLKALHTLLCTPLCSHGPGLPSSSQ